jgi:hypothetical protein
MYDWINAFSPTGHPAPVNATLWLRLTAEALQGTDADRQGLLDRGTPATLDQVIAEYALKDEDPDIAGGTTISDNGPSRRKPGSPSSRSTASVPSR